MNTSVILFLLFLISAVTSQNKISFKVFSIERANQKDSRSKFVTYLDLYDTDTVQDLKDAIDGFIQGFLKKKPCLKWEIVQASESGDLHGAYLATSDQEKDLKKQLGEFIGKETPNVVVLFTVNQNKPRKYYVLGCRVLPPPPAIESSEGFESFGIGSLESLEGVNCWLLT
ncbi:hypothetical protein DdX_12270 [Ditylenchus destructor]|uniref:Uncharacterized protein n=1 Tax=Ditylenchus destructor TaxID=166010 RepID=A0AAD4MZ54_9BILA|nr:hypothetical protein DdX_12270 [Ditylenchus destructor]